MSDKPWAGRFTAPTDAFVEEFTASIVITSYSIHYTKLYDFVILYYRASPASLELAPNHEECSEARWFPREDLAALSLPAGTRHILSKLFPELGWGNGAPPGRRPENETPGFFGNTDM